MDKQLRERAERSARQHDFIGRHQQSNGDIETSRLIEALLAAIDALERPATDLEIEEAVSHATAPGGYGNYERKFTKAAIGQFQRMRSKS